MSKYVAFILSKLQLCSKHTVTSRTTKRPPNNQNQAAPRHGAFYLGHFRHFEVAIRQRLHGGGLFWGVLPSLRSGRTLRMKRIRWLFGAKRLTTSGSNRCPSGTPHPQRCTNKNNI